MYNAFMSNTLFYGDNLSILQQHVLDASVDLVYLDPPFNSNRDYNVLFREQSGRESPAQIKASAIPRTGRARLKPGRILPSCVRFPK